MSEQQVKFGIVGCGVVATGYYLPYVMNHPQAEVTAVCDLDKERTDACVRLYGAKASSLPKPRGFNYYQESTAHLIDCILHDKEPIPGPEWGLHITEMMWGAVVSARSGRRYEMTTTL